MLIIIILSFRSVLLWTRPVLLRIDLSHRSQHHEMAKELSSQPYSFQCCGVVHSPICSVIENYNNREICG